MNIVADMINVQTIVLFLLIAFRIAGIFLTAPLLGNRSVPARFKLGLVIMLSLLVIPFTKFEDQKALTDDLYLIVLILQEVTIGVIVGFAAALIFAAVQVAGELLGMKIGFGIAQFIDPANAGSSGIMGSFYVLFGGLMFIYLNGHHAIIQGVIESFHILPLGKGFSLAVGQSLMDLGSHLLEIAIKMAAPVIIVITMLNLLFGFITKLSPQMNVYFNVGFILGPLLGIFMVIVSLPLFRVLMTNLTNETGEEILKVLKGMKGA